MKRFFAMGVLALCLMNAQIARADEARDAKIKSEIVQNYFLLRDAMKIKDPERLISFESPDYTEVAKNGSVTNKQIHDAAWRDGMKLIKTVYDARVEFKKLTVESNRVVVLNNEYLDADIATPDGVLHRVSATIRQRDIWVEYDGVWLLKRTEIINRKFIVDGKPEPV